jgi:hypothetical protein
MVPPEPATQRRLENVLESLGLAHGVKASAL